MHHCLAQPLVAGSFRTTQGHPTLFFAHSPCAVTAAAPGMLLLLLPALPRPALSFPPPSPLLRPIQLPVG
jgi:hypothetical protein